jgi:carbon storage regulator
VLVLLRRPGERIVINGELTITVIDAGRGQVRLGFEAPRTYQILREELAAEIQAENRAGVGAVPGPGDLGKVLDLLGSP